MKFTEVKFKNCKTYKLVENVKKLIEYNLNCYVITRFLDKILISLLSDRVRFRRRAGFDIYLGRFAGARRAVGTFPRLWRPCLVGAAFCWGLDEAP
jgi:hypothetical protein